MKKAFRHGDVLVVCGAKIPKVARRLDDLILAEGEVTGHKHEVVCDEAELYEHEGTLFLRVNRSEGATLKHPEHDTLIIPKGDHEIRIQREYTPEGWQYVQD